MYENQEAYAVFNAKRQNLIRLIKEAFQACSMLEQKAWADSLQVLEGKVRSDQFKVMVVGNFKSGKSTFINAMLGERVLPAYAVPCTGVISEIKWADQKQAILHFRSPLPQPLPPKLSPQALQFIEAAGGKTPTPQPIPIECMEQYVAIPDPGQSQEKSVAENPFEKVELLWPLELCKNGVEIIDSPGLNEHGAREKITVEYLPKIDAILFVLNMTSPVSANEMVFVKNSLHPGGHKDIFFIGNRMDQLNFEEDRESVRRYSREKLVPMTDLKEKGVFFLSAFGALKGRMEQSKELVATSGILEIEKALSDFLINQRGKVKLLQPTRELRRAVHFIRSEVIPGQRFMLEQTLDELQAKLHLVEPKLADARRAKDQLTRWMQTHFTRFHNDVEEEATTFLTNLTKEIPGMVVGMETMNAIDILKFKQSEQVETLTKEVVEKLEGKITERVNKWKADTLDPLFEQAMKTLTADLEISVEQFYERLDGIQASFGGQQNVGVDEKTVSNTERFFASVTGLLMGDLFSGLHGARYGFSGLLPAIGAQIALIVGMTLLGVANPFVWFAVLAGGGLFVGLWKAGSLTETVKTKIAAEVAKAFSQSVPATLSKIRSQVEVLTSKITAAASQTLERDISSIQDQLDTVLNDKRSGEARVQEKRQMLERVEKQNNQIDQELSELILGMAES